MKVLSPGRKQQGWATEATCTGAGNDDGGCGAKLLVDESDVFYTMVGANYGGDTSQREATFKCCECGVLTDLPRFPRAKLEGLISKQTFDKRESETRRRSSQDPLE